MAYWLDDGFDTWPEVVRAGCAAVGLYIRCGAWISRSISNGTGVDALIPAEVAAMYGTPEWVGKLVAVGLWRTEEVGLLEFYRDVYYFQAPNGSKLNPSAKEATERREKAAARQRRYRAKQAEPVTRDRRVSRKPRDALRDASQDGAPSPPLKGKGARSRDAPLPTEHCRDCNHAESSAYHRRVCKRSP